MPGGATNTEDERRLDGRVALITGGSGGIGAATARRLAAAGAFVVVGFYKNVTAANELVGQLPGDGHRAIRIAMEDTATIKALVPFLEQDYGQLDILINSAGFTRAIPHADLEQLDDETFDAILTANVRGPFAIIRALAPILARTGNGVIINVSSVAGFRGTGSNIAYAASKAALDTMSISLARVLGPSTRVMSVSPAGVDTRFVPGRSVDVLERAAQNSPLKKLTLPDDVARAIMAIIIDLPLSTGNLGCGRWGASPLESFSIKWVWIGQFWRIAGRGTRQQVTPIPIILHGFRTSSLSRASHRRKSSRRRHDQASRLAWLQTPLFPEVFAPWLAPGRLCTPLSIYLHSFVLLLRGARLGQRKRDAPRDFQVRHQRRPCGRASFSHQLSPLLDRLHVFDYGTLGWAVAFGSAGDLAAHHDLDRWQRGDILSLPKRD